MGLHAIHDDGTLHWKCLGRQEKCQEPITAHISHESIQWHEDGAHVLMPSCPKCGATMLVRVEFDEEDLAADNMLTYGMVPEQHTLPHAITGEPIPVMIPALKPVGANPAIAKHQELARQLRAIGKHPPEKNNPPPEVN